MSAYARQSSVFLRQQRMPSNDSRSILSQTDCRDSIGNNGVQRFSHQQRKINRMSQDEHQNGCGDVPIGGSIHADLIDCNNFSQITMSQGSCENNSNLSNELGNCATTGTLVEDDDLRSLPKRKWDRRDLKESAGACDYKIPKNSVGEQVLKNSSGLLRNNQEHTRNRRVNQGNSSYSRRSYNEALSFRRRSQDESFYRNGSSNDVIHNQKEISLSCKVYRQSDDTSSTPSSQPLLTPLPQRKLNTLNMTASSRTMSDGEGRQRNTQQYNFGTSHCGKVYDSDSKMLTDITPRRDKRTRVLHQISASSEGRQNHLRHRSSGEAIQLLQRQKPSFTKSGQLPSDPHSLGATAAITLDSLSSFRKSTYLAARASASTICSKLSSMTPLRSFRTVRRPVASNFTKHSIEPSTKTGLSVAHNDGDGGDSHTVKPNTCYMIGDQKLYTENRSSTPDTQIDKDKCRMNVDGDMSGSIVECSMSPHYTSKSNSKPQRDEDTSEAIRSHEVLYSQEGHTSQFFQTSIKDTESCHKQEHDKENDEVSVDKESAIIGNDNKQPELVPAQILSLIKEVDLVKQLVSEKYHELYANVLEKIKLEIPNMIECALHDQCEKNLNSKMAQLIQQAIDQIDAKSEKARDTMENNIKKYEASMENRQLHFCQLVDESKSNFRQLMEDFKTSTQHESNHAIASIQTYAGNCKSEIRCITSDSNETIQNKLIHSMESLEATSQAAKQQIRNETEAAKDGFQSWTFGLKEDTRMHEDVGNINVKNVTPHAIVSAERLIETREKMSRNFSTSSNTLNLNSTTQIHTNHVSSSSMGLNKTTHHINITDQVSSLKESSTSKIRDDDVGRYKVKHRSKSKNYLNCSIQSNSLNLNMESKGDTLAHIHLMEPDTKVSGTTRNIIKETKNTQITNVDYPRSVIRKQAKVSKYRLTKKKNETGSIPRVNTVKGPRRSNRLRDSSRQRPAVINTVLSEASGSLLNETPISFRDECAVDTSLLGTSIIVNTLNDDHQNLCLDDSESVLSDGRHLIVPWNIRGIKSHRKKGRVKSRKNERKPCSETLNSIFEFKF